MPADTVYTRHIPVLPSDVPGAGSLGRHVRHDPRSLAYAYAPSRKGSPVLRSASHARRIPVLDQGDVGKCTAEASIGAIGSDPFFATLADLGQLTFDDAMSDDLYSQITREDSYDGSWPPDDTGSDGLTAAKVLEKRGLVSGYQHALTLDDALAALSGNGDDDPGRPFITGINWYSSFDQPRADGEVRIGSQAYVRGGHEIVANKIDVQGARIWFWNSWGTSWGLGGSFCMSFSTFGRLLDEDGDVTIFVPRGASTPPADPADVALAAAFRADNWVGSRHVGANDRAAKAAALWLKARGL